MALLLVGTLLAPTIAFSGMVQAEVSGDYEYRWIDGGQAVEIVKYNGGGGAVIIPGLIGGRPVTSLGNLSFRGCSTLTSVVIPDSVTLVGKQAFYFCPALLSATLGKNVTMIGIGAFEACVNLTTISIPGSVRTIGDAAFFDCRALTSVTMEEGVVEIGPYAFAYCYQLADVSMPNSIRTIGEQAFVQCFPLRSMIIPEGVTTIEAGTFSYCTVLTSVVIPESVTSLGDYAFFYTALGSVILPDNMTTIGRGAFTGCEVMSILHLGNGLTSIGIQAFLRCSSLTEVTVPGSVTYLGDLSLAVCANLTRVLFEGDAPSCGSDVFINSNATTVYYLDGRSGWSNPWQGVPSVRSFAPTAPNNLTAAVGNGWVELKWKAPSNDGGIPVDHYVVWQNGAALSDHPTETTIKITGLRNGVAYDFFVAAHNAVGTGANSTPVSARPQGVNVDALLPYLAVVLGALLLVDATLILVARRKRG